MKLSQIYLLTCYMCFIASILVDDILKAIILFIFATASFVLWNYSSNNEYDTQCLINELENKKFEFLAESLISINNKLGKKKK